MDDEVSGCAGVLIGFVAAIMFVAFLTPSGYDDAYKQGQIDALTNNIKYELIEHPDGTKSWESIEDE